MNPNNIRELLIDYNNDDVDIYINYLNHLVNEKKGNTHKNPWMSHRPDSWLADAYKLVSKDNLAFDGKHITIQSTGISYDYVAYKNKMMNIYPESLIDVQLVKAGDKFKFSKESGHVTYQHEIVNPFGDSDIIGAYCVIKNKRGEFLTTLSREEIDKHRKVAKTDFIWKNWFNEMVMKTIIKKACKTHFSDAYHNIETLDNEQYDLEQPLGISIDTKTAIEAIETLEALREYYFSNKEANNGVLEDFNKACADKKQSIKDALKEAEENQVEENANS